MAWWVVNEEIAHIDLEAYQAATTRLLNHLRDEIGDLYVTRCVIDRTPDCPVKTFLWVKTCPCIQCGQENDLFPGRVLAEDDRHPKPVLVCAEWVS